MIELYLHSVQGVIDNLYLHQRLSLEVEERREAENRVALLAQLPSELPVPVARVSREGVVLFGNLHSGPILKHIGAELGTSVSAEWKDRILELMAQDERQDLELACDDRLYEVTLLPVPEENYLNIFGHEVTEYRRVLSQLEHTAFHDDLTGLPNRLAFSQSLSQAVKTAERDGSLVGLLIVDLNGFKRINDLWGHSLGDEALKESAFRLHRAARQSETVARIGGDEFGVILSGLEKPEDMVRPAKRIIEAIAEPFNLSERVVPLSCSIGMASFPIDARNHHDLQRFADLAMYEAKRDSLSGLFFYNKSLQRSIREKNRVETELRDAIKHHAFEAYFQPIVDLVTLETIAVEALVRLRSADGSLVSPAEFIGVAEESGLIREIGHAVLKEVRKAVTFWRNQKLKVPRIAINISSSQLTDPSLHARLQEFVDGLDLPSEMLELEITESSLVENDQPTLRQIELIDKLGLSMAIDDFGTGYSSLSYLRNLPVSTLKIDRSFITDLNTCHDSVAIVEAIISMGKALGLRVIAEGIETFEQAEALRVRGCRFGQGFFFGRPASAENVGPNLNPARD